MMDSPMHPHAQWRKEREGGMAFALRDFHPGCQRLLEPQTTLIVVDILQ